MEPHKRQEDQMKAVCLRHFKRQKGGTGDPEMPTVQGELVAYGMGIQLRELGLEPGFRQLAGPSAYARRTNVLMMRGFYGLEFNDWRRELVPVPELAGVREDDRFDGEPATQFAALKAQNELAGEYGILTAGAQTPLGRLRDTKVEEIADLLAQRHRTEPEKDLLVAGLHGGLIDGLHRHFAARCPSAERPAESHLAGYCEGFLVEFGDEVLTRVIRVILPSHLRALTAAVD